jgi:hypothetical protein
MLKHNLLFFFFLIFQAPHYSAAGSDVEEKETIEDRQFAPVYGREKYLTELEPP